MAQASEKLEAREAFNVSAQRIATTYAEALYATAAKRGQVDQIMEEMISLVSDVFAADARVETLFSSVALSRNARAEAIDKVFKSRSSETFHSFLHVLNQHERLELIRPIARALRDLHDRKTNRIHVLVTTAVPLAEDSRQRIVDGVRHRFNKESVLQETVDPAILGGLKIRIGDHQFDGTVRTRIENLRNKILARSSHEIQSRRDRFCS